MRSCEKQKIKSIPSPQSPLPKCLKDIKSAAARNWSYFEAKTFHKTFVSFSEEFLRKRFLLKDAEKKSPALKFGQ